MKIQWKSTTCAVALVAAVGTVAAPGDRMARGPIDLNEVETRAAEAFARVDTVADGTITLDEFLAAAPDTMAFRMDGDRQRGKRGRGGPSRMARPAFGGDLDEAALAERRAEFEERRAERAARRDEHRDRVFSLADADASGDLSKVEYDALPDAARTASQQGMFHRLDTNGDEFLTAEEFPPHLPRLRALDINGDGLVTRDEMPRRGPRG